MKNSCINVGILSVEEQTSHIDYLWGVLINPLGQFTRATNMTMTHVFDQKKPIAEDFARRYSVPFVVDRHDGMAGKVDAVIMSGYKSSYWTYELLLPYLEAGIPALIDRPGAYSLAGIKKLLAASERYGAPIMVTDSHEHVEAVSILREEMKRIGPLKGVVADNPMINMRDFPMHGIHGWYLLYGILGGDVRRVSAQAPDWENRGAVMLFEYNPQPGGEVFYTALHQHVYGHRSWIKLYGKNSFFSQEVVREPRYMDAYRQGEGDVWRDLEWHFFLPGLLKFQKMVETRKMPQTHGQILEKTKIFLAMYKSFIDHKGAPVLVEDLPDDWTAPNPHPGYYPDGYFN